MEAVLRLVVAARCLACALLCGVRIGARFVLFVAMKRVRRLWNRLCSAMAGTYFITSLPGAVFADGSPSSVLFLGLHYATICFELNYYAEGTGVRRRISGGPH